MEVKVGQWVSLQSNSTWPTNRVNRYHARVVQIRKVEGEKIGFAGPGTWVWYRSDCEPVDDCLVCEVLSTRIKGNLPVECTYNGRDGVVTMAYMNMIGEMKIHIRFPDMEITVPGHLVTVNSYTWDIAGDTNKFDEIKTGDWLKLQDKILPVKVVASTAKELWVLDVCGNTYNLYKNGHEIKNSRQALFREIADSLLKGSVQVSFAGDIYYGTIKVIDYLTEEIKVVTDENIAVAVSYPCRLISPVMKEDNSLPEEIEEDRLKSYNKTVYKGTAENTNSNNQYGQAIKIGKIVPHIIRGERPESHIISCETERTRIEGFSLEDRGAIRA